MVTLDVRIGSGRSATYEVGEGGFLIGSVAGCDLRLPGSNLAPVLCLLTPQGGRVAVRKLVAVQPLLVNDRAVSTADLNDSDCISVGGAEITVHLTAPTGQIVPGTDPDERERRLREQEDRLEVDQALWQTRRQEIEAECRKQGLTLQDVVQRLRQQEDALQAARTELTQREEACRRSQMEVAAARAELETQRDVTTRQQGEVQGLRRELTEMRQQLYQRYQARRDRLAVQQQAVRRAARKLQERMRRVETAEARFVAREQEWQRQQIDIDGHNEQISRERQFLDEQFQVLESRQQEAQRDLTERGSELLERERRVAEQAAALEQGQKQHQADLVRLDRIQAMIEQRLKRLQQHALEVDRRSEQLQRDSRELEDQAAQLDAWHNRVVAENERLEQARGEQAQAASKLDERAAVLEGQQAMLATLRTRLERMREELGRQELALSDQRALQEAGEKDLAERQARTQRLQVELENDRSLFAEERRRFEERQATLATAISQLRQAQETFGTEAAALRDAQQQVAAAQAEQTEQAALLTARSSQLDEMQKGLTADREALREREAALVRAEQALATLQEQVRRRSDELNALGSAQETEAARLEAQRRMTEQDQQLAGERLDQARQELAARITVLDQQQQELARREELLRQEMRKVEEDTSALTAQRQVFTTGRLAWEVQKQKTHEEFEQSRSRLEAARTAAAEVAGHLPELESRAAAAIERLLRTREQLRASLAEVHEYARLGREDLEAARRQLQTDAERLQQQEVSLQAARDEHRLAVAAFRQQLVEWQGRVADLRQLLEERVAQLARREAEVEAQACEVATASARLAEQTEQLAWQQRVVAERRGEVDRHLEDMREWYRRKLRELAGLEPSDGRGDSEAETALDGGRGILALTDEIEPGDRQLGERLRALDLIDADTLAALLLEARRQRRSLRQVLLAGNYLTLYQMALIEVGNLDGLVLGPVRVIDRLQATPREAMYRVFDPRRNTEALLRHLAESEMEDAVRPDEFRQRFAAAAVVRHPNVAATLEVFEIADRPSVLQEWVQGAPSTGWPALAAAPGVWFRLLSQAALALQTIHEAGLIHGHLHADSFVFSPEGTLKLCGVGEPRWLAIPPPQEDGEPSVAADLTALGHIASGWATTGKAKPLPEALQTVLRRLTGGAQRAFGSARDLLDDLDRAGADIPANAAAWERFVRMVREETDAPLRQSA
jgi:chromosome segregation ATPase